MEPNQNKHNHESTTTHTKEKRYACDQCDKSFARLYHMKRHKMVVHEKIRPFVCDICDKRFNSKGILKQHSTTHTGDQPHACDQCDRWFAQPAGLRKHKISVHQIACPQIACDHCSKLFHSKSELGRHSVTHTDERPFSCDQCDKSFKLRDHLGKDKMVVHQGIRPHICKLCGQSYASSSNLKCHMHTHTGDRLPAHKKAIHSESHSKNLQTPSFSSSPVLVAPKCHFVSNSKTNCISHCFFSWAII